MTGPFVLVVDDDTRLRRLLRRYLSENGFQVSEAPSADEAFPLIQVINFDIIIMDVMMPGTNGYEMVKKIRETGNKTPVLMLTAMGETENRILGLESGADDYLSKPFEPRELILRINNILRRMNEIKLPTNILFGSCVFEIKTGSLVKNNIPVALTGTETELLRLLAERKNDVVSRSDLTELMKMDSERTVDVLINRLRKKIEDDIGHPICIQTVRGQGYTLVTQ